MAGALVFPFFNFNAFAASIVFGLSGSFYPLAKRYTYYPQVVLGICFNSGLIISSLVLNGVLDYRILPFYFSSILWTLIYDTIYAMQDAKDDVKAGVKGLALKWGDKTIENSKILNVLMHAGFAYGAGIYSLHPVFYAMDAVSLVYMHLQLNKVDINDTSTCAQFFHASKYYGLYILLMIIMGKAMKKEANDTKAKDKHN